MNSGCMYSSYAQLCVLVAKDHICMCDLREIVVDNLLLAFEHPDDGPTSHVDAFFVLDLFEDIFAVRTMLVKSVAAAVEANLLTDLRQSAVVTTQSL